MNLPCQKYFFQLGHISKTVDLIGMKILQNSRINYSARYLDTSNKIKSQKFNDINVSFGGVLPAYIPISGTWLGLKRL